MSKDFKLLKFGHMTGLRDEYFRYSPYSEVKSETQFCANSIGEPYRMCISTCISSPWLSYSKGKRWLVAPKFFLVLDCDTQADATRIEESCHSVKMDYIKVPSGVDGHYWFFCNNVGTVDEICDRMALFPGCDQRYAACSRMNRSIHLRAFPKNGILPKVETMALGQNRNMSVIVHDSSSKSYKTFKKLCLWAAEFREYWLTYYPNGENANIVPSQIDLLNHQSREVLELDDVLVSQPFASVKKNTKYFDYEPKEDTMHPVAMMDLDTTSVVSKRQEEQFNPISTFDL